MNIIFDENAIESQDVRAIVSEFLRNVATLEKKYKMPVIVFQDGVNGSYYTKCSIQSEIAVKLCSTDAKLDYASEESFVVLPISQADFKRVLRLKL